MNGPVTFVVMGLFLYPGHCVGFEYPVNRILFQIPGVSILVSNTRGTTFVSQYPGSNIRFEIPGVQYSFIFGGNLKLV